jgi:hypothetical protein
MMSHRATMAVAVLFGEQEKYGTSQLRRFKHAPGMSRLPPIGDVSLRRSEPPVRADCAQVTLVERQGAV